MVRDRRMRRPPSCSGKQTRSRGGSRQSVRRQRLTAVARQGGDFAECRSPMGRGRAHAGRGKIEQRQIGEDTSRGEERHFCPHLILDGENRKGDTVIVAETSARVPQPRATMKTMCVRYAVQCNDQEETRQTLVFDDAASESSSTERRPGCSPGAGADYSRSSSCGLIDVHVHLAMQCQDERHDLTARSEFGGFVAVLPRSCWRRHTAFARGRRRSGQPVDSQRRPRRLFTSSIAHAGPYIGRQRLTDWYPTWIACRPRRSAGCHQSGRASRSCQ